MNPPVKRRRPNGGQKAGDAVDKVESDHGGVAWRRSGLACVETRIGLTRGPEQADKGIEHMQAGAGQPAAWRFLGRQPPAFSDLLGVFVAVVTLDVKQRSELSASGDLAQRGHR